LEPECLLSYGNIRVFSIFLLRASNLYAIVIHGKAAGPRTKSATLTRPPTDGNTPAKDHDHGSYEEEEEGEEGSEEVIRTFFRIRKRLDESPAALLLGIAVSVYSWRAMLLPSNT